jgi:hypothetical protein
LAALIEDVGKPGRRAPHAPFPEPSGQYEAFITVPGACHQTLAKGPVRTAIVRFDEDHILYFQPPQPLRRLNKSVKPLSVLINESGY